MRYTNHILHGNQLGVVATGAVFQLLLFLMLLFSCDETLPGNCYICTTTATKEYCTYSETTITTDPPRCNWTADEIRQLEQKGTFTIIEKCFTLIQQCKCDK